MFREISLRIQSNRERKLNKKRWISWQRRIRWLLSFAIFYVKKEKMLALKRFWVREIFKKRAAYGLYNNLLRELRIGDSEFYFVSFSNDTCIEISKLYKQSNWYKETIPVTIVDSSSYMALFYMAQCLILYFNLAQN